LREDHGQSLFGVQFNHLLNEDQPLIFASVGSNKVSVYQCLDDGSIHLLQSYADPDVSFKHYNNLNLHLYIQVIWFPVIILNIMYKFRQMKHFILVHGLLMKMANLY